MLLDKLLAPFTQQFLQMQRVLREGFAAVLSVLLTYLNRSVIHL